MAETIAEHKAHLKTRFDGEMRQPPLLPTPHPTPPLSTTLASPDITQPPLTNDNMPVQNAEEAELSNSLQK